MESSEGLVKEGGLNSRATRFWPDGLRDIEMLRGTTND